MALRSLLCCSYSVKYKQITYDLDVFWMPNNNNVIIIIVIKLFTMKISKYHHSYANKYKKHKSYLWTYMKATN